MIWKLNATSGGRAGREHGAVARSSSPGRRRRRRAPPTEPQPCPRPAADDTPSPDGSGRPLTPAFSGAALAAGIRGGLSFQLYTNRGGAGALNLFSREPYAVAAEGEAIGAMLATHDAGLMMTVNRRQEFESALASRDLMGQAKGVLMNRFSVDAVRAFEMMVQQSRTTNTPVRIIAEQIVNTYAGGSTPSVALVSADLT